LSFSNHLYSV